MSDSVEEKSLRFWMIPAFSTKVKFSICSKAIEQQLVTLILVRLGFTLLNLGLFQFCPYSELMVLIRSYS